MGDGQWAMNRGYQVESRGRWELGNGKWVDKREQMVVGRELSKQFAVTAHGIVCIDKDIYPNSLNAWTLWASQHNIHIGHVR